MPTALRGNGMIRYMVTQGSGHGTRQFRFDVPLRRSVLAEIRLRDEPRERVRVHAQQFRGASFVSPGYAKSLPNGLSAQAGQIEIREGGRAAIGGRPRQRRRRIQDIGLLDHVR
jgi:hypothetical protein